MKNFKNLIAERLKADSAAVSATNAENFGGVTEKFSADVSKVENLKNENIAAAIVEKPTDDDVPIYTATAKEIHYWHACVNIHVLDFLRLYDLDRGTIAFDSFKIGVDEKTHSATFALDDTHYLKFELNDTNVRPMDEAQAEKVLRKINSMRFEKNKKYPYRGVRRW